MPYFLIDERIMRNGIDLLSETSKSMDPSVFHEEEPVAIAATRGGSNGGSGD